VQFADVLADAQAKGYAEADPTLDIGGGDAGHKLALLAALAFGVEPDAGALPVTGIERVSAADIALAGQMGYAIRLIARAEQGPDGTLSGGVEACLVPRGHPLAQVSGPNNAVHVTAAPVGHVLLEGPGAGAGPTASAVAADVIALARGAAPRAVFGAPVEGLAPARWADAGGQVARFYLRLSVADRPGVLAAIAGALRDAGVSIGHVAQHGRDAAGGAVPLILTTHEAPRAGVTRATQAIADLDVVDEVPQVLRILDDESA